MRATTKENSEGTYSFLVDGVILATRLPKEQALDLVLKFNEIEMENKELKKQIDMFRGVHKDIIKEI